MSTDSESAIHTGDTPYIIPTRNCIENQSAFFHIIHNVSHWLGDHPQPDSAKAVDGLRNVGFTVLLVLYHYLCYKNDVILYDQSSSYPVSSITRNEFQALSLTKLYMFSYSLAVHLFTNN